ncbi:MAG TPA: outer membrane protein assembly factor BamE, partial [Dongiaceae bacterium]|nr:outer membrane protein assembly factor BamE [Dongiaceae bacterium]
MRSAALGLLSLGTVAVAACEPVYDTRGNLPDPDSVLQIQPGVDDRRQVAQLLGSPSTVATFNNKTWYYISKKTKTVSFLDPEVLDQEVLAIKFDDAGVVSDMRIYGLENARTIVPDPNVTPTSGKELTILQQIMGNIGRFGSQSNNNNP